MATNLFVNRHAEFSEDRKYRYSLSIGWGPEAWAAFIGLNPSTADEFQDDPTIRRCRAFASAWGCGGMTMLNLFAFRATDPREMKKQADPIGPGNTLEFLEGVISRCYGPRVACWGKDGKHLGRSWYIRNGLRNLTYLKMGKNGEPCHPLYLPGTLLPVEFK